MGYIEDDRGNALTPPDPTPEEVAEFEADERHRNVRNLMDQIDVLISLVDADLYHEAGQQACRVAAAAFDCEPKT